MTTKELIEKLKEIDPDGNLVVVLDSAMYPSVSLVDKYEVDGKEVVVIDY